MMLFITTVYQHQFATHHCQLHLLIDSIITCDLFVQFSSCGFCDSQLTTVNTLTN